MNKDFIFTPGVWLGTGKITFASSPEFVKFYTKWDIQDLGSGRMRAKQTVEMEGISEPVINIYTIHEIQSASFKILLENELIGQVCGTGLFDAFTIAWEFRGQAECEGFETYERQEKGDYFLHAEYGTSKDFRTIIEGLIWSKGS